MTALPPASGLATHAANAVAVDRRRFEILARKLHRGVPAWVRARVPARVLAVAVVRVCSQANQAVPVDSIRMRFDDERLRRETREALAQALKRVPARSRLEAGP